MRRLIGWLHCMFAPHEPHRRRVRKQPSGQHYGYCRFCGQKIRRRGYNDWARHEWAGPDEDQDDG